MSWNTKKGWGTFQIKVKRNVMWNPKSSEQNNIGIISEYEYRQYKFPEFMKCKRIYSFSEKISLTVQGNET